jgi:Ca2+-binding RTX toxin-like protein
MANPFFDAAYYLARNPDVVAAGYTLATAEQHYNKYGAFEVRAANPWFDARAYLAAYPDLAANGVTLTNALAHYTAYGINENRSPATNVKPADFTYSDYAANNPDLRAVFGIGNPAQLTVLQQHQLLAHYLSYGLREGRSGVDSTVIGSFFAPPAAPGGATPPPTDFGLEIDGSHASKIYIGSDSADIFHGAFQTTGPTVDGTTVKGQAGADMLNLDFTASGTARMTLDSIENLHATLHAVPATLNVTGAGVQTVSVTAGGQLFTYQGATVGQFNLLDTGDTGAIFSNATGANDSLAVTSANGVRNAFSASGIEHYDLTVGSGSTLNLHANTVDGSTLSVIATGGAAGQSSSMTLFSSGSAALQSATLDASGVAGNQTLAIDASLAGVNTRITGGGGGDTLTGAADALHISTLIGGAGNDVLRASAGQDLMTGGAGADIFFFGAGTALGYLARGNLDAIDTIQGYQSEEQLIFAGDFTSAPVPRFATAVSSDSAAATLAAIQANELLFPANQVYIFNTPSNIYLVNTGAIAGDISDTSVIKLVGFTTIALSADRSSTAQLVLTVL